jgi:hypothetical protein
MTKVRVALRKELEPLLDIPTSWEGQKFTPTKENYAVVSLLPATSEAIGLNNEIILDLYILNVELKYKINEGVYDVEEKAYEIKNHFRKGLKLRYGNICLQVVKVPEIVNLGIVDNRETRVISIYVRS